MSNKIKVETAGDKIPVRRRNTGGVTTVTRTVSLPKELDRIIETKIAEEHKSRSLVVIELITKGLTK